jgi:hypothetical protein
MSQSGPSDVEDLLAGDPDPKSREFVWARIWHERNGEIDRDAAFVHLTKLLLLTVDLHVSEDLRVSHVAVGAGDFKVTIQQNPETGSHATIYWRQPAEVRRCQLWPTRSSPSCGSITSLDE